MAAAVAAAAAEPVCNVCGDGYQISNPDIDFEFSGKPIRTCGEYQSDGDAGLINPDLCTFLGGYFADLCCEALAPSTSTSTSSPIITPAPTPTRGTGDIGHDIDVEDRKDPNQVYQNPAAAAAAATAPTNTGTSMAPAGTAGISIVAIIVGGLLGIAILAIIFWKKQPKTPKSSADVVGVLEPDGSTAFGKLDDVSLAPNSNNGGGGVSIEEGFASARIIL